MSLFGIALRSIFQRGVASLLTMLSMGLGVMLVVAVLSIHGVVSQSFRNNASLGYNVIVGAKGGREQLVLNTVFYLSKPVENIPYTYYLEFVKQDERDRVLLNSFAAQGVEALRESAAIAELADGGLEGVVLERVLGRLGTRIVPDVTDPKMNAPPVELGRNGRYGLMTELAIPVCLGDYLSGFRVVGTTPALFDDLVYDLEHNRKFEFAQGRNFQWRNEEHGYFEAVIGSTVAREITLTELHLKLGTTLASARTLISEHVNWSRIEQEEGTLVVTLGQGTAESDFYLALRRLDKEVRETRRKLSDEKSEALRAILDPAALMRSRGRTLTLGDSISPRHGDPEGHTHARKFTVVGILRGSGTPNDRAVFINMEGFYLMEDHAKPIEQTKSEESPADLPKLSEEEQWKKMIEERKKKAAVELDPDPMPLPVEQREVTAVLLKVPIELAPGIENGVNEGSQAQAVLPVAVIYGLFEFIVNPIQWTLLALTSMICVVSAISILVSIYNSMSERRGEIAVMRALGAGRGTVMTIILIEATLLALGGGMLGWLAGHLGCLAASPLIEEQTGVLVGFFNRLTLPAESMIIPALVLLAIVVGLWPAISAYRTDVARSLGK